MGATDRLQGVIDEIWASEEAKMKGGLDYKESEVRMATVHILKQALQLPVGLGAILGCLRRIRTTLFVIAVLLALIAYKLYA